MSSLDAVTEAFDAPQLLTVDEAARLLRIGRSRAYELANAYLGSGGTTGMPVFRLGPGQKLNTCCMRHALIRNNNWHLIFS